MSAPRTPWVWPSPELLQRPALRSILLFLDFFLIILAYYQVKPASRSLFLEYADARDLPYVWAASAALLLALLPLYERLLKKYTRLNIVLGTCGAVLVLLMVFRILLLRPSLPVAVGFYLLVDVFSVVLVEQFWSLTNSVFRRSGGRRWYGLIASGGLVGGLVGGFLASALVSLTPVKTADLPLVAAAIIGLMMWLTTRLARHGLYNEAPDLAVAAPIAAAEAWQALRGDRFLILIALMLLLSQMGEPIIEYQFMHLVEQTYVNAEERTAYLSGFFSVLSGVALIVNLLVTPLILRRVGALGGLMVQPLLLGLAAAATVFQYQLVMAGIVKICDRALAYSINRTSRELMYLNVDTATIYRAKAWIDMVGYRTFKLAGIATILLLTQWLPWTMSAASLSWVVIALCAGWIYAALQIGKRSGRPATPVTSPPARGDAAARAS